ncbi:MAG: PSD1 and planctomycete cytochrome C domain-containing protein [Verrucomicrobiae bacterium]|nr:PSD1 and planctomycete cytochrome C domain-containing protein [Verrucomicrobiae bacterium]NNJ43375.1 DUF1553 domain-containing protein [Akkermansiaceae bacterium]
MLRKLIYLTLIGASSNSLDSAEVDFAHEVVPLMKKHCIECHGGGKSKGGFSMNTRALVLDGDVLELGKPEKSLLMELLLTDDEDERMPPIKKQKHPLAKKEIDVFRRWIASGLPWEEGVTFAKVRYEPPLKPRKVKLPQGVVGAAAVDYFVGKTMRKQKTAMPPLADDAVFLRRLYLDVTGLPPHENARKLLAQGKLDRAAAVDRVLSNDRAYAEHWMVFWNDLLRNEFAGTGFIDGGRQQVTGWLYGSLLENKPYDVFVRELISPVKGSSGFMKGIKWRGSVNASQTQEIQFSQNVSQVFLGINMKCASCHDSFVNQWSLKDAYSLAAITADEPLEMFRCDKPTGEIADAAWIYPELGQIDPNLPRDKRLAQLAELMTHPENGRMQRTIVNRLWRQLIGRGIVHPMETMNAEPWSEELLDFLANTLVEKDYDLKAVMRVILNSDVYRMQMEQVKQDVAGKKFRGPVRRRLTAEQFLDAIRSTTGVWPEPDGEAFRKKGAKGGQLNAVMLAHGMQEWDARPLRASFTKRGLLQAALGRPNREQVVTSRPELITTLEAMNLANGDNLALILRQGAAALIKQHAIRDKLIRHVYAVALTREPSAKEWSIARSLAGNDRSADGVEDFLWMVFMLPEFNYVN